MLIIREMQILKGTQWKTSFAFKNTQKTQLWRHWDKK